jgi:nucleoid-associated protein YgaU
MIADANDIDDQLINPFELTTGLILIIPNKSKFESLQS